MHPITCTATRSPLPQLPDQLLDKQKSLTELRDVSQKSQFDRSYHPTYHKDTVADIGRVNTQSPKRKSNNYSGVMRKHSSAIFFQSDPNTVPTCYSPPLESLADPLEIVERLKREPDLGFLYLTPVEDYNSVRYNPYNLRYGIIINKKLWRGIYFGNLATCGNRQI